MESLDKIQDAFQITTDLFNRKIFSYPIYNDSI